MQVLKTSKEDTNKVKTLNLLCSQLRSEGEFDKDIEYGKQSLLLARKLDYKKGAANAATKIGSAYEMKGELPEALKYYLEALKIYESVLQNKTASNYEIYWAKDGIATSYGNVGNVYSLQGNLKEALKNQMLDLKIAEEIGNKKLIANAYNNIGIVHYKQNNMPEALKNFSLALKKKKEIGNKQGIASSHSNIGAIYIQYASSFDPSQKEHYWYKDSAKFNFQEAIEIYNELHLTEGLIAGYINLAQIEREGNTKEAKVLLEKALKLSLTIGYKEATKVCYKSMAAVDSILGDHRSSYENYKKYILYQDSLKNEENTKKMIQAQMQYEFDKKEVAAKAEQDKKDAIATAEKQKQQIVLLLVSCVLVLVVIFSFFVFRNLRTTRKQKAVIEEQKEQVELQKSIVEEKQKEIIDSINYARRIQKALLPNERYIDRILNKKK